MIRHDERRVQLAESVHLPAQPAERNIRGQQVLGGNAAHREHELGL